MADHFVRVSLAGDGVSSRPLRCSPSGETRDRKIKAPPKEMYRTAFTHKTRCELLKHPITLNQYPPKPVGSITIVGGMFMVLGKGNRIGHLIWFCLDLYFYCQSPQRLHHLSVEVSHGTRRQRYTLYRAVACLNDQSMVDEVEIYLERAIAVRNIRCRKTSWGDIQ